MPYPLAKTTFHSSLKPMPHKVQNVSVHYLHQKVA